MYCTRCTILYLVYTCIPYWLTVYNGTPNVFYIYVAFGYKIQVPCTAYVYIGLGLDYRGSFFTHYPKPYSCITTFHIPAHLSHKHAKHKKQLYGTMYCTTINTLNRPVPCIYSRSTYILCTYTSFIHSWMNECTYTWSTFSDTTVQLHNTKAVLYTCQNQILLKPYIFLGHTVHV